MTLAARLSVLRMGNGDQHGFKKIGLKGKCPIIHPANNHTYQRVELSFVRLVNFGRGLTPVLIKGLKTGLYLLYAYATSLLSLIRVRLLLLQGQEGCGVARISLCGPQN